MKRSMADRVVLRILTVSQAIKRGQRQRAPMGDVSHAEQIVPDDVKAGLEPITIAEPGQAPQEQQATGLPPFDGTGGDLNTMLEQGPLAAILESDQ